MEIIQFKSRKTVNVDFDYQAVRDSILGEFDALNIEASVRHISTDFIGADEDTIKDVIASIRNQLTSILAVDECAKHLNDALLELDAICIAQTTPNSMGFGSSCILFKTDAGPIIEIHVLQTGFVRFIKTIRVISSED